MDRCDDYPVRNIDAEDIPTWEQTTLPVEGYLLMAAVQKDQQCGKNMPYLYHLPLGLVTPGSTFQANTYTANGNGFTEAWDSNQVRAGYTYNNTPNDIRLASKSGKKAQYIILKQDENDAVNYILQGSGFYTFPSTHAYFTGYSYYLGTNGMPTTDSSFTQGKRQHLFEVIDQRTILINIYEEQE